MLSPGAPARPRQSLQEQYFSGGRQTVPPPSSYGRQNLQDQYRGGSLQARPGTPLAGQHLLAEYSTSGSMRGTPGTPSAARNLAASMQSAGCVTYVPDLNSAVSVQALPAGASVQAACASSPAPSPGRSLSSSAGSCSMPVLGRSSLTCRGSLTRHTTVIRQVSATPGGPQRPLSPVVVPSAAVPVASPPSSPSCVRIASPLRSPQASFAQPEVVSDEVDTAVEKRLHASMHSLFMMQERLASEMAQHERQIKERFNRERASLDDWLEQRVTKACEDVEGSLSAHITAEVAQLRSDLSTQSPMPKSARNSWSEEVSLLGQKMADRLTSEMSEMRSEVQGHTTERSTSGMLAASPEELLASFSEADLQVVEAISNVVLERIRSHDSIRHVEEQHVALRETLQGLLIRLDGNKDAVPPNEFNELRESVGLNCSLSLNICKQLQERSQDSQSINARLAKLEEALPPLGQAVPSSSSSHSASHSQLYNYGNSDDAHVSAAAYYMPRKAADDARQSESQGDTLASLQEAMAQLQKMNSEHWSHVTVLGSGNSDSSAKRQHLSY